MLSPCLHRCIPRASSRGAGNIVHRHLATVSSGTKHLPLSKRFLVAPLETNGETEAYADLERKARTVRKRLRRPLTLSEKILYAHLADPEQALERGSSHLALLPKVSYYNCLRMKCADLRVDGESRESRFMFISTSLPRVRIPTSVHTDHLVTAQHGAVADLEHAKQVNEEVYAFLQSACDKYGIAYWKPGAGILHQIIFERYAYPGGFMIGTDSHTPNAAGLGMLAIGCGGMEGVDAMAGAGYEIKHPKIIGVHLKGKLGGWASAKDVILKLASILTVKGGTDHIIEYYGDGVGTLSATGMATIGNMGAEVGATSSVFPFTQSMGEYLRLTGREETARAAETEGRWYLSRDEGAVYDRHIQIDLSDLEPHVNGPFTPDLSHSISTLSAAVDRNPLWPVSLSAALIGSCTNSSYEDFSRSASLIKQASSAGLHPRIPLLIAPGSEEIRSTLDRDGILDVFTTDAAGTLLANACGACVGQWEREDVQKGQPNSIISSFNRNFVGRQDGNSATHSFVSSPEIVTAMAYGASLRFNPLTDSIPLPTGESFRFAPPTGDVWPERGYHRSLEYYQPPKEDGADVTLEVDPRSSRIQLIVPFEPWGGEDVQPVETLIKVKGKCTTDHISAAGPWYKYRGHLQNISENLLIGAVNAENDKVNCVKNRLTGGYDTVPSVARSYRDAGRRWVVIGSDNYGEGSSREVAAMSPRYMGCFAVIAKSMARIHETNLKKQGVLSLYFRDPADYDKITGTSTLCIHGLATFTPGRDLEVEIVHDESGEKERIPVRHTYNHRQIEFFKAGSALNVLAAEARERARGTA